MAECTVWAAEIGPAAALAGGGEALGGGVLDRDERARAAAFRVPTDAARYVGAHLTLRGVLGEVLAVDPAAVRFGRATCPGCGAPHGRPEVAAPGTGVHFSLTYAASHVLVAVSDQPVGIDVEPLVAEEVAHDLTPLLHPGERAELAGLDGFELRAAFTRIWVRKEAYLKGTGEGIGADLCRDYLGTAWRELLPPGWQVCDYPGADPTVGFPSGAWVRGLVAALAIGSVEPCVITTRRCEPGGPAPTRIRPGR